MKPCGALLVLLCCCVAETQFRGETIGGKDITQQGHYGEAQSKDNELMGAAQRTDPAAAASTQQTCQPDIHTVLREMSILMTEQRVELRHTKTQMEALQTRLRASENKAEIMETRLRASEMMVKEQRVELKQTEARLTDMLKLSLNELMKKQLEQAAAVKTLGGRVNLTGNQVDELRREREERKVSFSASLVESSRVDIGPFPQATPLVYTNVFTNIGNAYNANTGVFTAPIRGVYHFVVFVFGHGRASTSTGVTLHKNREQVFLAYSYQTAYAVSPSNGVSLLLEVGDVVYLKLWPNSWVHDTQNHHNTFSGHLLFSM